MDLNSIQIARSRLTDNVANAPKGADFAELECMARAALSKGITEARVALATASEKLDGAAKLETEASPDLLPPLEDVTFLRYGLDTLKGLVFNGPNSIDVGVTGSRLNKISRRLIEAAETVEVADSLFEDLADRLADRYPGYDALLYRKTAQTLAYVCEWDKGSSLYSAEIEASPFVPNILESLSTSGKLALGLFVCPPVEFGYLCSEQPEQ